MRRVGCPRCGVKVGAIPSASGKHRLTDAYAWFLPGWAKRLSYRRSPRRSPPHRDITNIEAIGHRPATASIRCQWASMVVIAL